MTAEHPILFSTPMVRAILAGKKSQTRRVVSARNSLFDGGPVDKKRWGELQFAKAWVDPGPSPAGNPGPYLKVPREADGDRYVHRIYPRIQPGDRLWVKETWCRLMRAGHFVDGVAFYAADGEGFPKLKSTDGTEASPWRPSIFMPRWASRINLEVTAIRVERLQDMTREDAYAEGLSNPGESFPALWDAINGKRPGCSWADNPWVYALTFCRLAGPVEAINQGPGEIGARPVSQASR